MSRVIVTGASGDLGRAVVLELHRRSWDVVGLSSADGDLRDPDVVHRIVHEHASGLAAVVHLVGGIIPGRALGESTLADLDAMYALNVVPTFNILTTVLPLFRRQGAGSIVTVGAQAVTHPVPNRAAYTATKAAVVALTRSAAEEGRPDGARANCLLPSIINTAANRSWATPAESAGWPTPEVIAHTIGDLVDPRSAVNGAVIPIFGTVPF